MGGDRRHGRGPSGSRPGRQAQRAAAGARGAGKRRNAGGRQDRQPVDDARLRHARRRRQARYRRGRGRRGDAGRLQARQAPACRRRSIRAGAHPNRPSGAPARRARLPRRGRRDLLRREPRARAHSAGRDAANGGADCGQRLAPDRLAKPHPAAAQGQSEMPTLRAGDGLPAGRGSVSQRLVARAANDRRAAGRGAAAHRPIPARPHRQGRGHPQDR